MRASRQAPDESPEGAPAYIVSYGALMTILLTFFILMCTMAQEQEAGLLAAGSGSFVLDIRSLGLTGLLRGTRNAFTFGRIRPDYAVPKEDTDAGSETEGASGLFRPLKPEDKRLDNLDRLRPRHVLLRIPTTLCFAPGGSELNWHARRELDRILRRIRNTRYGITIQAYVDPHTSFADEHAGPVQGWALSARRAQAVARYFHDRGYIPYERLIPVGYSYNRPVSSVRTQQGSAANDRLVIVIYAD